MSPISSRCITTKIVWLLLCISAITLTVSCRQKHTSPGNMPWDTGDSRIDSLLDIADRIEMTANIEEEEIREVLTRAELLAKEKDGITARAAGIYASARLMSIEDNSAETHRLDSLALKILDATKASYLTARIKLHLAQHETGLEEKTDLLFEILPAFIDARDSMRVVETLYELNKAYGRVWDNNTQIEYLTEILNYVPDSIPILKGVMHSNIIRLKRFRTDSLTYLRSLDSLRNEKELMDLAPSFGVLVFSDLYRLRGNDADLDTAGEYFKKLEVRHNAARVYNIQRLKQAIKARNTTSADTFGREVRDNLSPDDRPLDMEAMRALIDYYDLKGDRDVADSIMQRLNTAVKSADAYERALTMARMNADRRIEEFRKYSEQSHSRRHLAGILIVGAIILITVGGISALIFIYQRRRHRMHDLMLKEALEKAQRRLTVAQMRNVEKERALSTALRELESGSDTNDGKASQASEIRERLGQLLSGDNNWERFSTVFTEMRPGFIDNLKREYPNLTPGDIRLCCFLEMGLETRHTARLLMIRPESVKKHKKRLRDKFDITPETPWEDFFAQF